jgi:cytochrome c oxidase cbb3-type subunit I/II
VVEARSWQSGAPWIDSVQAARPYWVVRAYSGVLVAVAFVVLLVGLTTGPRRGGRSA